MGEQCNSWTPLHHACSAECWQAAVSVLITCKAKVDICLRLEGNRAITLMLDTVLAPRTGIRAIVHWKENEDEALAVVSQLIAARTNLSIQGEDERSASHIAISQLSVQTVVLASPVLMLIASADLSLRASEASRCTPHLFTMSCMRGEHSIIEAFLRLNCKAG